MFSSLSLSPLIGFWSTPPLFSLCVKYRGRSPLLVELMMPKNFDRIFLVWKAETSNRGSLRAFSCFKQTAIPFFFGDGRGKRLGGRIRIQITRKISFTFSLAVKSSHPVHRLERARPAPSTFGRFSAALHCAYASIRCSKFSNDMLERRKPVFRRYRAPEENMPKYSWCSVSTQEFIFLRWSELSIDFGLPCFYFSPRKRKHFFIIRILISWQIIPPSSSWRFDGAPVSATPFFSGNLPSSSCFAFIATDALGKQHAKRQTIK